MVEYDLGQVVGPTGATGATGNGISSIVLYATSGLTKTYRVTYTNGDHFDFDVNDGSDSSLAIVTSFGSPTSDEKVPSEKLTKTELDKKIGKSNTNGLVKNDGTIDTTAYLSSLPAHTHGNLKNDGTVGTSGNTNKNVVTDSNGKITVEAKPTVPSKISDLTNDSDFIETSSTAGLIKNDGTIDTNTYVSSSALSNYMQKSSTAGLMKNDGTVDTNSYLTSAGLSNYVQKSNTNGLLKNDGSVDTSSYITSASLPTIQTSFGSPTSDSKVPSEKLVKTELDKKIATSQTAGLVKNDGTVDTTSYSTFSGAYGDLSGKPTIPSKISDLTDDSDFISKSSTSGLVKNDGTIDTTSYSTFSGAYSDLSGKPTIPSKISDLTNDSDFIETSSTAGLVKNDGSIDTSSYATTGSLSPVALSGDYDDLVDKPTIPTDVSDLTDTSSTAFTPKSHQHGSITNDGKIGTTSGLPVKTGSGGALTTGAFGTSAGQFAEGNHTHSGYVSATKVTSWSSTTSDSNVPSEKLVKDTFDDIEDLIGDAITYINQ